MNFQYLKEIFFLIGSDKKKLPLMVTLFLFLSILDLAGIGLIAPYVTLISNPIQFNETRLYELYAKLGFSLEVSDLIISLGLILFVVFLFKAGLAILINYVLLKFCHRQSVALRASLMRSYQYMPYINFTEKNSSSYIHNVNLADKFATGTLLAMLRIICDGTVVIAIVIFLAFTDIFALCVLLVLLLTLSIVYDTFFKPRVLRYGKIANSSSIQVLKSIQESMIGMKEIRILGKENFFFSVMFKAAKQFANVSVKTSMVNLTPRFLLELIIVIFVIFLVFSTIFMEKNLSELVPLLSMFGIASLKLAPASTSIISGFSKMRFYRDAVGLVYKDVTSLSEITDHKKAKESNNSGLFEGITLNNIEFCYPAIKEPAIKNATINIRKTDVIGFIGASGSGKTTLINIILALLQPQKGEIFYNGLPLNESSLYQWRSLVAYLPQDIFLLDDTLEKNIALGVFDNEIDKDRVRQAIDKARLVDLVDSLPKGINTIIGERGIRVSGGQKQRISLARAFYHEREVLIMDESTSALDSATEKEIVEEINRLKGEKTIIVIAHRKTTLKYCNAIYRLDKGTLSRKLTYEEILVD